MKRARKWSEAFLLGGLGRDMSSYRFERVSRRSLGEIAFRLVFLLGLPSGFVLVGTLGSAQAQIQVQTQVQTQTAIAGGTYQMSLGQDLSEGDTSPRRVPIRIPGGVDALEQIKTNQPGAAAQRQEPATSASQEPATSAPQAVLTSCQTNSGAGFFPSDSHGAAGPTNLVTVTNVDIGVYNKTSCALVSKVPLKALFGGFSIPATQTLFDPRVLYDPAVGRFIVTAESDDSTNTDQFQYFAVSTDNSGTAWFMYRFTLSLGSTFFCKRAANRFWDYPSAGYSSARWFITANDFLGNTATGAILSIDKAPSLVGTSPQGFCFNNLASNIAPPLVQDSSTTPFFLSPGSGSSITRYRLNQGANAVLDTLTATAAIAVTAWTAAPSAAQPNGQTLDTLDGRFQSATIQNGTSLWNVHTVNVGGAVARLYQFSTTGTSPLFTKDLLTAGDDRVFNPSVAVNATNAFVTATRTWPSQGSPTGNAAMVMFRGPNSSSSGYTFDVIATSTSQFTQEFVAGVGFVPCNTSIPNVKEPSCRWGDYSATQIDPSDTSAAWGFNQLVTGTTSGNWTTQAGLITGGAVCGAVVISSDFNNDCRNDILWRNDSGAVAIWLMNGLTVQSAAVIATVSNDWHITDTGDFNGDGKSDILWRNDSGAVAIWLMNGLTVQSAAVIATVSNDWHITDTGDFNGDGKSDILWRNDSGAVAIWLMNGLTVQSAAVIATVSNDWHITDTGDFNGDGKSDILWRNDSGAFAIWLMNGFTVQSAAVIATVSNDWHITDTGDFNGDGKSDILWRNDSGAFAIWLMNGFTVQSAAVIATVSNDWHITDTGDFNGDGKSDILWRNDSGAVAIWLMNGFTVQSAAVIATVSNDWHIEE